MGPRQKLNLISGFLDLTEMCGIVSNPGAVGSQGLTSSKWGTTESYARIRLEAFQVFGKVVVFEILIGKRNESP